MMQKIKAVNSMTYKKQIKFKIRAATFKMLKARQQEQSKVRYIEYDTLETQSYMVSPIFTNQEVCLLHALRSRSTDCKANFKNKYGQNNQQCRICNTGQEDQQHLLECVQLNNCLKTKEVDNSGSKYEDVFSKEVGSLFFRKSNPNYL